MRPLDGGNDTVVQAATQLQQSAGLDRQVASGDVAGCGEPDDAGNVQGATAASLFLSSPGDQRLDAHASAEVEDAYSLRSVELVSGEGGEVAADGRDVEGQLPNRLGRIAVI